MCFSITILYFFKDSHWRPLTSFLIMFPTPGNMAWSSSTSHIWRPLCSRIVITALLGLNSSAHISRERRFLILSLVVCVDLFIKNYKFILNGRTCSAELNSWKLSKNSMFVNISNVMMDCYPISEWEVPFNWEWLVRNSVKTITSFAYFTEN